MFDSCSNPGATRAGKRRRRQGFVLLTTAAMVALVLLPAVGLGVDTGLMYLVQSRLSAACDAASLAGARGLARGSDDSAQRTNAEATANLYFAANFPSAYFGSTNLQVTNVAATDSTFMRSITSTASVDLPFVFLRMLTLDHITLRASAKATRRDVNVMIVMDRSKSLADSFACAPLKAAAVNFVDKFAEGRDNVGLVTFATGSRVDVHLTTGFKTPVEGTLTNLVCNGATNSAQGLWQSYQELSGLAQTGALNVVVFFTDGHPTAVTQDFPLKSSSSCTDPHGTTGTAAGPKRGVLTLGGSTTMGLYRSDAPAQPLASDLAVMSDSAGCRFVGANNQDNVTNDVAYAPPADIWGNSLTATAFRSVSTSSGNISISSGSNVESFSMNAADHAGLRIRRGDPDPLNGNRTLGGVMIYSIGLGIDAEGELLLKRIANDPSLTPNPVAAGNLGRYVYAANASELDLAFTRVASELLRLAR